MPNLRAENVVGIFFWVCTSLILYVYFGYPLTIVLLASCRKREQYSLEALPRVSLIIAAYNEEKSIERKLHNCFDLSYPPELLEIIVAADGSNDRTVEIVQRYSSRGVILSYDPERAGKMAAINRGFSAATGDIVVLSDANNHYTPETIRALAAPFSDSRVGAVSGSKAIIQSGTDLSRSEGSYWKYEALIKKSESRFSTCTAASAEILAIRRNLFQPPPTGIINDDFWIIAGLIRQGYRVVYAPQAQSLEHTSLSAADEVVRRSRIVAGRYQAIFRGLSILPFTRPVALWQILSHKFLRPVVPFFMIGALISGIVAVIAPSSAENFPILYLAYPFNYYMLACQGLFYGAALVGSVSRGIPIVRLAYFATFLVASNFAAIKGLGMYLTQKNVHLWKRVARHDECVGETSQGANNFAARSI